MIIFNIIIIKQQNMSQEYQDEEFDLQDQVPLNKSANKKGISRYENPGHNKQRSDKLPHVRNKTIEQSIDIKEKGKRNLNERRKNSEIHHSLAILKQNQSKEISLSNHTKGMPKQNQLISKSKEGKSLKQKKEKSLLASQSNFSKQKSTSSYIVQKKVIPFDRTSMPNKKLLLIKMTKSQKQQLQLYSPIKRQQLQRLSNEEIFRLNNKIRQKIMKLDQELTNKLQLALKIKKNHKQEKSDDKIVQILDASIKNNQGIISNMEYEYNKLYSSNGQIYEDQYELMIQREQNKIIQEFKQQQKSIVQIKYQIKQSANKLSDLQLRLLHKKKDGVKEDHLKIRKEEEKQVARISKLDEKIQEMKQSTYQIDINIEQLMQKCKEMNISLDNSVPNNEYYLQLKAKLQKLKGLKNNSMNQSSRGLLKIKNEIKNMRNEIKQYNDDIGNTQFKISSINTAAITLIEVHKPMINPKYYEEESPVSYFINKKQEYQSPIIPVLKNSSLKQKNVKLGLKKIVESSENEENQKTLPFDHKKDHILQNKSQVPMVKLKSQPKQEQSNEFLNVGKTQPPSSTPIVFNDKNKLQISTQKSTKKLDDKKTDINSSQADEKSNDKPVQEIVVPKRFQFRRTKQKQSQKQII